MTKSGIAFEAGDIVLVPFPFTNMSQTKPRPVLILSNTACHGTNHNKDFKKTKNDLKKQMNHLEKFVIL